jgi:hypothetical protein
LRASQGVIKIKPFVPYWAFLFSGWNVCLRRQEPRAGVVQNSGIAINFEKMLEFKNRWVTGNKLCRLASYTHQKNPHIHEHFPSELPQ